MNDTARMDWLDQNLWAIHRVIDVDGRMMGWSVCGLSGAGSDLRGAVDLAIAKQDGKSDAELIK